MSAPGRGGHPRGAHPRSGAYPAGASTPGGPGSPRRSSGAVGRLAAGVIAAAVVVLLVGVGFSGALPLGTSSSPSAAPAASAAAAAAGSRQPASASGAGGPAATTPSGGGATGGSATPAASGSPASPAQVDADLAFVPVTSFRTSRTSVSAADVRAIAAGTSRFASLVLVKADAAAELAALHTSADALGKRLVTASTADALMTALAKHRTWLGFLRADKVGPGVRALAWGSRSLFGEARVASLKAWPLHVRLAVGAPTAAYDPASAWTVFAAGDLGLDRGAALAIKTHGNDPDYLYDGGTVKITGHCKDCSPLGWDLPYTKRLGHAGAMRALIKGADLAIANMEEVAVTNWTYHPHGTVFTGNPAYLAGVRNAGFDWVSMGNNHVGDFGPAGVLQSMKYLDKYGLRHGGAGATSKAAHKPSIVTVGGVKVALLSYDTVAPVYAATATRAGSAQMTAGWLKKDIKAAHAAGAQVVIVWPHWGVEYTSGPSASQQRLAHAAIDAGADLVIGNHPHWAQAMEVYKGRPIWYALGNFTFDQTWSEPTMEGISLELTFSGTHLVQAWLHPHLVLDYAQPNLMDPAGSGKVVLDQVFGASKNLPW
jgi:hypothetical protein